MKILRFLMALMLIPSLCFGSASRNFDGTVDLITGSTSDAYMTENGAASIVIWSNPAALANTICRRTDATAVGNVGFLYAATGRLRWFAGGGTSLDVQTNNSAVSTGIWQSYAVTWDGSTTATNVHIYISLIEATYALQQNQVTPNNNSTAPLTIGNRDNLSSDLNAKLAYLQIYSRVLTDWERSEATYKPGMIPSSELVFNPLWGDSTEIDLSGNGNTGSITGSITSTDGPPVMFGGGLPL